IRCLCTGGDVGWQRDARRRRLIRERTGHALRTGAVAARFFRGLFAANDLTLRTILFASFFSSRELDIGHDLRSHATRPDERREQLLDTLRVALFHPARDLELLL